MSPVEHLIRAFEKRSSYFLESNAVRLFWAKGDLNSHTRADSFLEGLAIDWFAGHLWISYSSEETLKTAEAQSLIEYCERVGAKSAVLQVRSKGKKTAGMGVPQKLFGSPSSESFEVYEVLSKEQKLKAWIQVLGKPEQSLFHPGLFLDHQPLRSQLFERSDGLRVLNLFSYTGALSCACGLGGAKEVTSIDLSKPFTEWAKKNWVLNGLSSDRASFIYGDVFDWLVRFKKKGRFFDMVVLDPPSFSRAESGVFSTSKDLVRLHELAFSLLDPGQNEVWCASTINSENVSEKVFWSEVGEAGKKVFKGRSLERIWEARLAPSFGMGESPGYLKGGIFRFS